MTDPATLAAWDQRYLWHPFTQMADWLDEEPLVIAEAEGCTLVDTRGRRYLDGVSLLWCNVHGHRHPALDAALRDQLARVAHSTLLGLANVPSIELARALIELAPRGLTRVSYSDAGATALAAALAEAERTLAAHGPTLAAVVVEPLVQGAAGMWVHPPAYLRALHELAHRHGTLLIADEVATGFGRTGRMFACEHAGITPDLMCLAKGISGGYLPLAATLATEEVFAAFLGPYEELRAFFHGHTYTGNPLGFAVALADRPLGTVIVRMPPLAIAPAELELLVDVAREAIEEVTGA